MSRPSSASTRSFRAGRTLRSERRAWYAALGLALVLSLLPTRWLVGWTADVAQLVNVPLIVLRHPAAAVRSWLRPMPDPRAVLPEEMQTLERELQAAYSLYKRVEIENDLLRQRIALLERAALLSGAGDRVRTRYAAVVQTTPPSARSPGSLGLNVGSAHGVTPGMIATWDGDILVGRVADAVQRLTSLVVPATGLPGFEVRFFPIDRDLPLAQAPGGVLRPMPDGSWIADLTDPRDIAVGWTARVADERWPTPALGLRVGTVEAIGPRDDAPLMRRIVVRPLIDALRVPHVVLTDDADPTRPGAREGGRQP
jgi:hypothetical protein